MSGIIILLSCICYCCCILLISLFLGFIPGTSYYDKRILLEKITDLLLISIEKIKDPSFDGNLELCTFYNDNTNEIEEVINDEDLKNLKKICLEDIPKIIEIKKINKMLEAGLKEINEGSFDNNLEICDYYKDNKNKVDKALSDAIDTTLKDIQNTCDKLKKIQ